MVCAVLSGMGNASGLPVRWSIIVSMCPISWGRCFCILWWDLLLSYWKVCWGILSFEEGNSEFWPFLCNKECSLQYISEYPCSYLSNNIVVLWGSIYVCCLDVIACRGLPLVLSISKTWGWQEQGISVRNLLHVYIISPWCE